MTEPRGACAPYEGCCGRGWVYDPTDSGSGATCYCDCEKGFELRWRDATVPCLSLTQPWASLVALGLKRWETRGWSTDHKGRLAIASSIKMSDEGRCAEERFAPMLEEAGARPGKLPLGQVLCSVELVGAAPTLGAGVVPGSPELWAACPPGPRELELGDYRLRGDNCRRRHVLFTRALERMRPFQAAQCPRRWCRGVGLRGACCNKCGGPLPEPARAAGALGMWRLPRTLLELFREGSATAVMVCARGKP